MKLIIDRMSTDKDFYTIEFGLDFDVLIGSWKIYTKLVPAKALVDLDMIVTRSAELKWCVMYIKHPLLLKSYVQEESQSIGSKVWNKSDEKYWKQPLREYFALRLQHRKYPVDLYDIGKRLFT